MLSIWYPKTALWLKFKPSKQKIVTVASCAVIIATSSTTAFSDGTLVAAATKDLASMMQDRSPGPRTSAKLTKSKQVQAPSARALPKTRTRKALAEPESTASAAPAAIFPNVAGPNNPVVIDSPELAAAFSPPRVAGAPGLPSFALLPSNGGAGGGGGGIGLPGGGGGGGGASGGAPPDTGTNPPDTGTIPPVAETPLVVVVPPVVVTPLSAVPEPATWAMMIGGFGMVGGAMRSARQKQKGTVSYA